MFSCKKTSIVKNNLNSEVTIEDTCRTPFLNISQLRILFKNINTEDSLTIVNSKMELFYEKLGNQNLGELSSLNMGWIIEPNDTLLVFKINDYEPINIPYYKNYCSLDVELLKPEKSIKFKYSCPIDWNQLDTSFSFKKTHPHATFER